MTYIPENVVHRLLKDLGAERVSHTATNELISITEDFMEDLGSSAIRYAHHAGRKTVRTDDIQLAVTEYLDD